MADDKTASSIEEATRLLGSVSTATLTTQLLKRGYRNVYMRGVLPLNPAAARFAGEAFTLRMIPAREDLNRPERLKSPDYPQRRAIEGCPAGQVLVIDCRRDLNSGAAGDILIARLKARGVAAVVTDGGMRDVAELSGMGIPVHCGGPSAPGSVSNHFAVEQQVPIGCGGVAVLPGDVLVGDADGVVVIPRAIATEVARDGAEQERLERFIQGRIRAGHSIEGNYPPSEATLAEYRKWQG